MSFDIRRSLTNLQAITVIILPIAIVVWLMPFSRVTYVEDWITFVCSKQYVDRKLILRGQIFKILLKHHMTPLTI